MLHVHKRTGDSSYRYFFSTCRLNFSLLKCSNYFFFLIYIFSDSKPTYQVLKHKSGFIPVFIRYGDTPLSDINPLLAEAFGEHDIKARNIKV